MNCNDIKENLSFYIDEALGASKMAEISEHLSSCNGCRAEFEALQKCVTQLKNVETVLLPESFDNRLKVALLGTFGSSCSRCHQRKKNRLKMISGLAAVFMIGIFSFAMYNQIYNDMDSIVPDYMMLDMPEEGRAFTHSEQQSNKDEIIQNQTNQEGQADGAKISTSKSRALEPQSDDDVGTALPESFSIFPETTSDMIASGSGAQNQGQSSRNLCSGSTENENILENLTNNNFFNSRDLISATYYVKVLEKELKELDFHIRDCWKEPDGSWCFRVEINTVGEYGEPIIEELIYQGLDGKLWIKELSSLTETAY